MMKMKPLFFMLSFFLCYFSFNTAFPQPKNRMSISHVLSRARGEILKGKPKAALKRMKRSLTFNENPEILPIASIPLRYVAPNRKLKNSPKGILENARFLFALSVLRTDYRVKVGFIGTIKNTPITMKKKQLKHWVEQVLIKHEKQKSSESIAALAEFELSIDPDSEHALNILRELAENGTLSVQFWALLARAEKRRGKKKVRMTIQKCRRSVHPSLKRFCKP